MNEMNEIEELTTKMDSLRKTLNETSAELYGLEKKILTERREVFKILTGKCYRNGTDTIFMVSDAPDYGTYSNWINFNQIPCLLLNREDNVLSFEEIFLRDGNSIEDKETLLEAMAEQYTPISKEKFISYCKGHIDDMVEYIMNTKENN